MLKIILSVIYSVNGVHDVIVCSFRNTVLFRTLPNNRLLFVSRTISVKYL